MTQEAVKVGRCSADVSDAAVVTVIMIFLNERAYLQEAIDSVLGQTYGHWELLLIDDGSTDGSSEIALGNAARHPERIRYLTHPGHANRGMSASRNLGLRQGSGRYIAFLDGDDVYHPLRLERHVQVLQEWPEVTVVQSDIVHWVSWQALTGFVPDDYLRPSTSFTDRILRAPLALMALVAIPESSPGICSLTVRRAFALELQGFEERFRSLYEDQVFLTKIYARGTVYVMEDYLARYRMHAQSTVSRLRQAADAQCGVWHQETRAFREWRLQYLASLPDRCAVLNRIILDLQQDQNHAAVEASMGVYNRIRTRVREWAAAHLPQRGRQLLWRLRKAAVDRNTLRKYGRLCDRATGLGGG